MNDEMTREQEKQEWIEVQKEVAQIQAQALLPIIKAFANTPLTLRQHYAGMFLQGMLSNPSLNVIDKSIPAEISMSQAAIVFADTLIAELGNPA